MYVTLEEAKKHLNIDDSFKDDDSYINSLILVAEDAIEKNTDIALNEQMEGGKLPPSVIHSILLLVGNLYAIGKLLLIQVYQMYPILSNT